ncbi:MAG: carboxypeptidase-like regulatory domain-containing protein [Bacteroidales bacterium]|nr:carboxypeptidase-like regulatory domain-containing protein [Bacteroidales bacterium]
MIKLLFFLSLFGILLIPNEKTITGTVTDEIDGYPLPGVQVIVKGTSIGTITDIDGKYVLNNVPDDAKTLVFSFVGMKTQEVKIKNNTVIDVTLKADDISIDDVVVTGLGSNRATNKLAYADSPVEYAEYDYDAYEVDRSVKKDYSYTEGDKGGDDGVGYDAQIRSGQLTAGEVNDFGKWEMWQDIAKDQLSQYQAMWDFYPENRYCVLLTDEENKPIINATVYLMSGKENIWTAKTDNTGKAELWANMFDSTELKNISIQVDYKGKFSSIQKPTSFHDGINRFTIDAKCDIPNAVDIAFVFDATSSMTDEMSYLQAEVLDVINRIDETHKDLTVNLGSVFYRDHGDDYVTIFEDFSPKIASAVDYIKEQRAWGGGDFPEAVDVALDVAVNQLSWSDDARARIIFLVLDAPPHNNLEEIERIQNAVKVAAEKGIRIIPITCSGVDKSTEYLMRSMALATNGTYVFLTDDSGIGGSHIKPTTDKWDVEFLNDLIVRLINQYVVTPSCENEIIVEPQDLIEDTVLVNYPDIDTNLIDIVDSNVVVKDTMVTDTNTVNIQPEIQKLKIYPNPTSGNLTIEISGEISEFYVCDFSGKILERHETDNQSEIKLYIGMFPQGIYFVRYFVGSVLQSGKVVLMY